MKMQCGGLTSAGHQVPTRQLHHSPSSTGQLMTTEGSWHKSRSFSLMKGAFTSLTSYLKLHLYPFHLLGVLSRQSHPLRSTSLLTSPTPCCVFSAHFLSKPFSFFCGAALGSILVYSLGFSSSCALRTVVLYK